jgi:phosphatidate cytidylyltransferase
MAAPAEPARKSASALKLRILSAAVLIPIVVAAVYAGHPAWDLLVILFAGVMTWEWCRAAARRRDASQPKSAPRLAATSPWPEAVIAVLLVVAGLIDLSFGAELGLPLPNLWVALAVGVVIAIAVGLKRHRLAGLWFGLGIAYVAVPCAAILYLRGDPVLGLQQIGWIVALVIAADTGAYIAGRSIGGPKLAPRISPNKTWAGLGGAVISAALVGIVVAFLLGRPAVWPLALVSAGLAVIEQAGDLAESAFKRHFGVKDASNIIPGHGGALDRVDGLIAVAAAVAGLNAWIGSSVLTWL